MGDRRLRVLQVSISDNLGGAEKMAWDLFQAYRARGHASWLAVGKKVGNDPGVFAVPARDPNGTRWARFWRAAHSWAETRSGRVPGVWRFIDLAREAARTGTPGKWLDNVRGWEDFRFPGTWELLGLPPEPPDVVHLHNLHGAYFDLRALPRLSRRKPVVVSLHDAWLLTGGCSHSFDCDRWKTGCGRCPHLAMVAHARRDATDANWRRKRAIYARSRLRVTTACHWLMDRVKQSVLAPGVVESRVIPYGIDLGLFRPAPRAEARQALGLPPDALVLSFVARLLGGNPAKDYLTLRSAVDRAARRLPGRRVVLLARGETAPAERYDNVEVRFVPWADDFADVALSYQASDVYLHAAKVDTFPLSVLEALACGTPVVGTAVGGIPEQIKSLGPAAGGVEGARYDPGEATGVLVPGLDERRMAEAIVTLAGDPALCLRLGENAARDARARFDLRRQTDDYLAWYEELCRPGGP